MTSYIIDAARTPRGRGKAGKGALSAVHPFAERVGLAMLLGTALDELERSDKQTALIAMCVGGGQGIATIIERV